MAQYKTRSGRFVDTSKELGRGGEGCVYEVNGSSSEVAKIYHPQHRADDKEHKLVEMVSNPPSDDTRKFSPPHITIAWPVDLLYDSAGFAGFIMPRINKIPEIHDIWSTNNRNQNYSHFDWRHLHRIAQNLAVAIHALHFRGYVVGDVNQRNILVTTDAMVTLIDTDSFQVREKSGKTHRCPVGSDEYTPPELQGVHMGAIDRHECHDCFGLGVLIFQLLMEGFHPFTGAQKNPVFSYGRVDKYCIKQGIFPYQVNNDFDPPPGAPSFNGLDATLRNLFVRCFVDGRNNPPQRPSAKEWLDALGNAEKRLLNCATNQKHWYSPDGGGCHFCELDRKRANRGVKPSSHPSQTPFTQSPPPQHSPPLPPFPRPSPSARSKIPLVLFIAYVIIYSLYSLFGNGKKDDTPAPTLQAEFRPAPTPTPLPLPEAKSEPAPPPIEPAIAPQAEIRPAPMPVSSVMVSIPGGCFDMGDVFGGGHNDEDPVHRVCVDEYLMDAIEVTNAQFEKFKPGFKESRGYKFNGRDISPGDNNPVINILWEEANGYCESMGKRLPTEAEWEYAARSEGKKVKYGTSTGELSPSLANYTAYSPGDINKTTPVGSYPPNKLGLYDMSGNAAEWVADWYDSDYYKTSPEMNPQGPSPKLIRVVRGGSWDLTSFSSRASDRYYYRKGLTNSRHHDVGFRCAQTHKKTTPPTPLPEAKSEPAPPPVEPAPTPLPETKLEPAPPPVPSGMVSVVGGCFDMGDTFGDGAGDEKPVHSVCIDSFNMDKYEVTNTEFEKWKPGFQKSRSVKHAGVIVSPLDNTPVVMISWDEAKAYCENAGKRLPTEAEWEYAARSGGKKVKYGTSTGELSPSLANYGGGKTKAVGSSPPNELGLYDMTGNVWEWVGDIYDKVYYGSSSAKNPSGPSSSSRRYVRFVVRGGAFHDLSSKLRSSVRGGSPNFDSSDVGFRCAQ